MRTILTIACAATLASTACSKKDSGSANKEAFDDYATRSKEAEVKITLGRLGKEAKAYFVEKAVFPTGTVGPTPATPCCAAPDKKCAPNIEQWNTGPWQELDFVVDEPSRYQYSYTGTGMAFTVTAVGDLACDGHPKTWTLTGQIDATGLPKLSEITSN